MNISLTPNLENYVHEQVETGDYNNASEFIREALREKMERGKIRAAKHRLLKQAIDEGLSSGDAVPLDIEEIKREGRAHRETWLNTMRLLIEEGENSSPPEPLEDIDTLLQMARKHRAMKQKQSETKVS